MMKQNVLVISTSLRKNSNSEILAKEFEKGAKAAGNMVRFSGHRFEINKIHIGG